MRIIKEVLSSGLTVILAPMAGAESTTGVFACRAGWKYETPSNNGIAHFLEHMAFKGTKRRPTALDIAKEVEGRGGSWNASTSEEMTDYFIKLPGKYAVVIRDILSDMVLNSKFEPVEIEKEKGTIVQELRMYQDVPQRFIGSVLWPKLLYGNQPAGWCGVGTEATIKALERKHFIDFLDGLYVSENSVLCLAGKITGIRGLLRGINFCFGELRQGSPKIIKPLTIESQNGPVLLLEPREIQQSHIVLGVRAYPVNHPRRRALRVLQVISGGNMSSRMFIEVREKRGLAYYVGTGIDVQTDIGSLYTSAGLDREKVSEAIKIIIGEYVKICQDGVPEEELERAKEFIIGSSRLSFEVSSSVAFSLARQWVIEGKITPFAKIEKEIRAVTASDVQSVAQEIFVNKGLNLAIIGPHHGMEKEFLEILKF